MTLSRVVSETFNVEKYSNLEIRARSRSFKVIDSGTIRKNGYSFLLVLFSNFVPMSRMSRDIRFEKIDL